MTGDAFLDAGRFGGRTDGALQTVLVRVVATDLAGTRACVEAVGGEDVLPDPFAGRKKNTLAPMFPSTPAQKGLNFGWRQRRSTS